MNAPLDEAVPVASIAPNYRHAFGGVWRLTFARVFSLTHGRTVIVLLSILAVVGIAMARAEHGSHGFLGWIVSSYLSFLVPTVAFLSAGGAMRDDFKSGTVDYILIRPIPRPLFVAFKFVAHLVAIEVELLLAAGVLLALGVAMHSPGVAAAIPRLLLGQAGLVFAFTAFGLLCGAITSRYVVVGLIYGAIVEVGVGQIPTQLSRLSMTHQVRALLQPLLAGASDGGVAGDASAGAIATTVLVLLGFSALSLAAAAILFRIKELTGASDA